jgi:hypothetical protein
VPSWQQLPGLAANSQAVAANLQQRLVAEQLSDWSRSLVIDGVDCNTSVLPVVSVACLVV